jgi:hypothetical protein
MSMLLAALAFVPLLAIAIAHFIWSLGGTWPIRDEALLARTVTGFPDRTRMPPKIASFGVAVAVLAAGIIALSLADDTAGGLWLDAVGVLAGLVFLARGIVGYSAWFAKRTPEEPFRSLDRKLYSPLGLALGIGFLVLVILRLL